MSAFIGSGAGPFEVAPGIPALSLPGPAGTQGPRVSRSQACSSGVCCGVRTRLNAFSPTRRRLRVPSLKVLGAADRLRSVPGRLPGGQDTQKPVQGVSAEEVFGSQHEQRW